ncbi:hypothetical protein, partial [Pseudomonas syringae group genomosp. 7]|uniref:hypothetical protein n=1 Tax=Pseudomonas syringae group genomosp. 7 TaxID=251699 RepID=UPI0037700E2C
GLGLGGLFFFLCWVGGVGGFGCVLGFCWFFFVGLFCCWGCGFCWFCLCFVVLVWCGLLGVCLCVVGFAFGLCFMFFFGFFFWVVAVLGVVAFANAYWTFSSQFCVALCRLSV